MASASKTFFFFFLSLRKHEMNLKITRFCIRRCNIAHCTLRIYTVIILLCMQIEVSYKNAKMGNVYPLGTFKPPNAIHFELSTNSIGRSIGRSVVASFLYQFLHEWIYGRRIDVYILISNRAHCTCSLFMCLPYHHRSRCRRSICSASINEQMKKKKKKSNGESNVCWCLFRVCIANVPTNAI